MATTERQPDLTFRIHGIPPRRTAQQKGYVRDPGAPGGVRVFTRAANRREAAEMLLEFRRQLPEGWKPRGGAARVRVDLSYPARKTDRLSPEDYLPHTERPDADNLVKPILDAMTRAGVWQDDAQVWVVTVSKVRRLVPRWTVRVWFDGKPEARNPEVRQGTLALGMEEHARE